MRFIGALCILSLLSSVAVGAEQPPAPKGQSPTPKPDQPAAGKPDTPRPVEVIGADAQTGVKVTTSIAATVLRLPLQVAAGSVKGLIVTVDDFVAADGQRITPTVTVSGKPANQPIDVTQKDRPLLEVTATFPVATDYRSYIVLVHSEGRLPSVPLTVTRQRNAVAAEIVGVETITATKWFTSDATIRFTVRETANQRAVFYPIAVDGLALKESDKVRKAADYGRIVVDGVPVQTDTPASVSESFVLGPQQSRPVVVKVEGIGDAGEYVGTLRLSSSNGTPLTKEFTVLVKSSIGTAALWIFLGVVASFLIRRYVKQERPKLQALRRVRYAEEDLAKVEQDAGSPPRPAAAVFAGLRDRLARIERTINDGTAKDGEAASLDEVDKRIAALPGWITTGRWLATIQPADIVDAPRAAWAALAGSYFLRPGATDDIAAAVTKIEADIKIAVTVRIKDFGDRVAAYKTTHPTAATEIDQRVLPALQRAKDTAGAGDWVGMTAAFREARLTYAKALTTEFDRLLTGPPPVGFDANSWPTLTSRITAILGEVWQESDPERAVARYDDANRTYLGEVISKLERVVTGLEASRSSTDEPALTNARTSLTAATLGSQKGEWDAARTAYETAAKAVTSVIDARPKAGAVGLAPGTRQATAGVAEAVPPGASVGAPTPLAALSPRTKTTAEQLSEVLNRYNWYLDGALLLIACVVGTSLLWLNDPVWGGWKAYTTAFLWGLGLHQVAGSTLDGLPAVTKKLTE